MSNIPLIILRPSVEVQPAVSAGHCNYDDAGGRVSAAGLQQQALRHDDSSLLPSNTSLGSSTIHTGTLQRAEGASSGYVLDPRAHFQQDSSSTILHRVHEASVQVPSIKAVPQRGPSKVRVWAEDPTVFPKLTVEAMLLALAAGIVFAATLMGPLLRITRAY